MADVIIKGSSKTIAAKSGEVLIDILRCNGIFVDAPCGGTGHCGKCKLKVNGDVSAVTADEKALLTSSELQSGIRLACLCLLRGNVEIEIAAEKEYQVTHFLNSSLQVENEYQSGQLGIAVDIGTTTVAVYFFELKTGRLLDVKSGMNLQREYGADVISRISACDEDKEALNRLHISITSQINKEIKRFGKSIATGVIAGNTTMLHLLTRLNPSGLARAPFQGESLFGVEYTGLQLGLDITGSVYLTPCVSAYVGGDITAGLVGNNLDVTNETVLYIDIGTNGEMALVCRGIIYCCSTAAGPAFEGARIKHGTGSVPGAMNRVWYENGVQFTTINDERPIGICGSGLIDALSVMLECGIIDDTGRLESDDNQFLLGDGIYITQQDVREVQLAKSAIAAGIETLFQYAETSSSLVSKVIIAGGFGAHINAKSAMNIGLLPKSLAGKFETVGNGAGQGASSVLLSDAMKARIEKISEKCKYIELSGDKYFADAYIEHMMFE